MSSVIQGSWNMLPVTEKTIFRVFLLLALVPVWLSGSYFVTGDGPCHVYNSRVLLDIWKGEHWGFYDPFYFVNPHFDPNWFGHVILAGLQFLLSPELAEKVFLSGYVLLFATGFRAIIRQIAPAHLFVSCVGVLFIWQHLLMQGFYNYVCSIALFFWVVAYWLWIAKQIKMPHGGYRWSGHLVVWGLLLIVLYSMHPIGLFSAGLMVGLSILSSLYFDGWRLGIRQVLAAGIAAIPVVVQLIRYILRKEWTLQESPISRGRAIGEWFRMDSLMLFDKNERVFTTLLSTSILIWVFWQLYRRIKRGWQWRQGDYILAFACLLFGQYLQQAGAASYELLMTHRLLLLSWLGFVLWCSISHTYTPLFRKAVLGISCVIMLALTVIRLPVHRAASAYIEDCMSSLPMIHDRSVILVLNYDFVGHDLQGRVISDRIWLFNHAADYLGAHRVSIMSDNYEATRHYFPLIWHWERDMFGQTDKDKINFDNRPPRADIEHFNQRTAGHNIDYVLIWGRTAADQQHPYSIEIENQLKDAYRLVHTSPSGAALLYQKK